MLDHTRIEFASDAFARADEDLGLDARARRFSQELIYGVLRRRLTLDCVIAAYAREPIAHIEPDCLRVLRLGLYQLLYMDGVPPFAAISASVDLLAGRHDGVRGLANGLLRAVSREANKVHVDEDRGGASPRKRLLVSDERVVFFPKAVFADPEESPALHLAQVYSHPVFLVERWLERHDRALVEEMLAAGNRKPRLSIRVNRMKSDRDGVIQRLEAEGIASHAGILPESVVVDSPPAELIRSAAFREGLFYVQDEAAMKVATALEPKPGERILDVCAAPGGKATHLAELTAGRAEIVAVDANERRIAKLHENIGRLGVGSIDARVLDPVKDKEEADKLGDFDAALIDVPCSNTGVLARRPEVRWRVSVEAIRDLADEGRALLAAIVPRVRRGGRIVYSTCSLEEEENQTAIERALVANPRLRLRRQEETLPAKNGPDGGFFAVFDVE